MAVPAHEWETPESTLNFDTKGHAPLLWLTTTTFLMKAFWTLGARVMHVFLVAPFDDFSAEKLSLYYHAKANMTKL